MAIGHYENFPVASLLLPTPLREPIEVIYRFARSADDFADEGTDPPDIRLEKLNRYRAALGRVERGLPPEEALFGDVARIVRAHGLPLVLFHDLLDAFSQDVVKKRYASFADEGTDPPDIRLEKLNRYRAALGRVERGLPP